jgi:hypothetical protein
VTVCYYPNARGAVSGKYFTRTHLPWLEALIGHRDAWRYFSIPPIISYAGQNDGQKNHTPHKSFHVLLMEATAASAWSLLRRLYKDVDAVSRSLKKPLPSSVMISALIRR